ncbi:hypothetical protein [Actinocatenispora sera]|uniref:Lipoprotein n=1 Tax=Actinocatenispora sera TaxID=390989 RepID=A0A810LAJ4_9ACTN|nr:hypothetical protein [Actinocatenispora sera]BCJ31296.1 hypothetical protein Asera_54040 [Actinocatenispora sera]
MRATMALAALTTAAALVLAGCGSAPDRHAAAKASASARPSASASRAKPASPSPAPTRSGGPRSLLAVSEAPIELSETQQPPADAVVAYWTRYGTAVSTRDLPGSGLAEVVTSKTGVAGTGKLVDALAAKNQRYRGKLVVNIRSVGMGGDTATVDACIDQSRSRLTDANGNKVAEPGKQNILPIAHTLVHEHGHWLIDRIQQGGFTC